MKAVVFGASGYAGAELVRLISGHSQFELVGVSGASNVGMALVDIYPHLIGTAAAELTLVDSTSLVDYVLNNAIDAVFLALPNNTAVEIVPKLLDTVRLIVDLSADFRLRDAALYERHYGFIHPRPDLLDVGVYGLCELNRSQLVGAKLIASPGCYVTAATLSLYPLIDERLISDKSIVVNGVSGISGAGRQRNVENLFGEIDSNVNAYGLSGHRHSPEIEQNLGATILFVPHVAPMTRGILTTSYADLTLEGLDHLGFTINGELERSSTAISYALTAKLEDFYSKDTFVDVLPTGQSPRTKSTLGTNRALISVTFDSRTKKLVSLCAIDNMIKGASGQAIQAANISLGFAEDEGLSRLGMYP